MTKDNAQNNTDWDNKEYNRLLKESNSSLLRETEKEMKRYNVRKVSCFMMHQ